MFQVSESELEESQKVSEKESEKSTPNAEALLHLPSLQLCLKATSAAAVSNPLPNAEFERHLLPWHSCKNLTPGAGRHLAVRKNPKRARIIFMLEIVAGEILRLNWTSSEHRAVFMWGDGRRAQCSIFLECDVTPTPSGWQACSVIEFSPLWRHTDTATGSGCTAWRPHSVGYFQPGKLW